MHPTQRACGTQSLGSTAPSRDPSRQGRGAGGRSVLRAPARSPGRSHRPRRGALGGPASPEGLRQRADRLCLTRGGEDGAGEEEGGGEVPVPVSRGVAEHRDAVVAGLQHPHQELLQLLLREAGVLLQEPLLQLAQLLAQQVFVGQLHRGEDHGAEHQVEQVAQHQQREAPGGAVLLHQPHAGAARQRLQHLPEPGPAEPRAGPGR